jgi:hypothetical protein
MKTAAAWRVVPLWPQLEEILREDVFGGDGPAQVACSSRLVIVVSLWNRGARSTRSRSARSGDRETSGAYDATYILCRETSDSRRRRAGFSVHRRA